MTPATSNRNGFVSYWVLWTVGFISFPLAGVVGLLLVDRVDTPIAALVAGAATGAAIGAGQWMASRRRLRLLPWVAATALGMGLGLLLGATVVGFGTSLMELAVMGVLTGAVLGVSQALALPAWPLRRWWWAAAMPILWGLGWVVSTSIGIAVAEQFSIFGASGAVTFSALSGLLLAWILPTAGANGWTRPSLASRLGRKQTGASRHIRYRSCRLGTLDALLRRGETVRMVNRSGTAAVHERVEVVRGNAAEPAFTVDVTRGAEVVYQGHAGRASPGRHPR
jgi:hypothetical protein